MSIKARIKASIDLILRNPLVVVIGIITLAIGLGAAGIVAYYYFDAIDMEQRYSTALRVPIEDMGYITGDYECFELIPEFEQSGDYEVGMIEHSMDALPPSRLGEVISYAQKGYTTKSIDSSLNDKTDGLVDGLYISPLVWEWMSIELIEGEAPPKKIESSDRPTLLIYLSDDYSNLIKVGDTEDTEWATLYVAGIIDRDSTLLDDVSGRAEFISSGVLKMNYGVLIVSDYSIMPSYTGLFIKKRKDIAWADVYSGLKEKAENVWFTVTPLKDVLRSTSVRNNEYIFYFSDVAIVACIISLLLIISGSILEVLCRTKDYGVWIISGATRRDVFFMILFRNFFYGIMAFPIATIILAFLLNSGEAGGEYFHILLVQRLLRSKVIPVLGGVTLVVVFLSSIVPALCFYKTNTSKMIKGEIS